MVKLIPRGRRGESVEMRILKQLWSQMWEKKGMHCNCDVWIRHLKMVDIFDEIEVERKAEAKDKEREKE